MERNRVRWLGVVLFVSALGWAPPARAEDGSALDRVIDAIVRRENELVRKLESYRPLVETYIQTLEPDKQLGTMPEGDDYFLGRLDLTRPAGPEGTDHATRSERRLVDLFKEFYAYDFQPDGFARMIVLDAESFDREHYTFEFVRREFLGDVRTFVFEVMPKVKTGPGRFIGRIWVEDEGYSIVRYNGTYTPTESRNLHFDSWRLNLRSDLWFPAYVYTEESEFRPRGKWKTRMFRGQTRIWGYEIALPGGEEEFAKVLVEPAVGEDSTDRAGEISPVESLRTWQREAEENVLRRLAKGGLLAPEGEVDDVLRTVVTNLEVTNNLDIQPPVRCRVLLTAPLESFTVGHTIVLSRGLIDVLPDEASLAMVLAHELGHILLGHQLDTRYAFSDRMLIGDRQAMEQFYFKRDADEEGEADEKALMLLQSSPYKDNLATAGLFLKALAARSEALTALIRPHFGNRFAKNERVFRMTRVVEAAPELYPAAMNQTAALPLGGRVKVDPWTGAIELMKDNQVVLLSPREKKPFEVTPLMPHLVRLQTPPKAAEPEAPRGESPSGVATVEHRATPILLPMAIVPLVDKEPR